MNNYLENNLSQTVSYLGTGLIAAALLLTPMHPDNKGECLVINSSIANYTSSIPSTHDQYSNIYSGEFIKSVDPIVEAMANLYAGLLSNQERLEPEFELVLNENLWELYES